MADRLRLRLDSDLAALLGAERLMSLTGTRLPFRSGEEEVTVRVAEVDFRDGGLFVTLVIDEEMPPGMARPLGQNVEGREDGLWIRVASGAP